MLFKSYILACIKLMINTCTVMVNLRLNVSLRSLATSKYNIIFLSFFLFLLVAKHPWRMKMWGRLKCKTNQQTKVLCFNKMLKHLDKLFPPMDGANDNCVYGERRCLWDLKTENLWCGLYSIYTNQRHFIHNLNQEVHNILETKFHKNFTSKKKLYKIFFF